MAQLKTLFSVSGLRGKSVALAIPCIILTAYLLGGEIWLLITALIVPLPLLLFPTTKPAIFPHNERDGLTGFMTGTVFEEAVDRVLKRTDGRLLHTACMCIELEQFHEVRTRYGDGAAEEVLNYTTRRMSAALRSRDLIARTGDARFVICLDPVRALDLEMCLQLASRLQTAMEEPVPLQTVSVHPTGSVGVCLSSRLSQVSGNALHKAADLALSEARRAGLSSVRDYHEGMRRKVVTRHQGEREAERALLRKQIEAWFQP